MNCYFITGSSRGLGKSLVQELLKNNNNVIYGLSRTNPINEDAFYYIHIDLSDIDAVKSFRFPEVKEIDKLILINNAGVIGNIASVGHKISESIVNTFNINVVAPSLLINQFINQYQNFEGEKIIINISSGAGRHSISSWADYCASKSALDMFSLVVADEQKEQKYPIKILSIAPGVLDSQMQDEIRLVNKNDFPQLEYFVNLKKEGLLSSTEEVAVKLLNLINDLDQQMDVLMDVRDS